MKRFSLLCIAFVAIACAVFSCKNKTEGEAATVSDAAAVSNTPSGDAYTVDAAGSMLNWEGSKVTGKHMGTIAVKDGKFYVADGNITGGSFNIDMNSIVVTDLASGKGKEDLENHLKGTASEGKDDFFNVTAHPTASYEITKVTALTGDSTATHMVYGNLNLKGTAKEVGFKAKVSAEGDMIKVTTPQFMINRTDFGIKYGSGTFFDNLGDKAINDNFGLAISVNAKKG